MCRRCNLFVKDNLIALGHFPNDKLIKTNDENVQTSLQDYCLYFT